MISKWQKVFKSHVSSTLNLTITVVKRKLPFELLNQYKAPVQIWWPLVEYAALVFVSRTLKEAQSLVYIKVQQAANLACDSTVFLMYVLWYGRVSVLVRITWFFRATVTDNHWSLWPSETFCVFCVFFALIRYIEIADNTFAHLHGLSLDWHLRKKMGSLCQVLLLPAWSSLYECMNTNGDADKVLWRHEAHDVMMTGTLYDPWTEVFRPFGRFCWVCLMTGTDWAEQAAQQTMQYVVLYLIPTLVEALAVKAPDGGSFFKFSARYFDIIFCTMPCWSLLVQGDTHFRVPLRECAASSGPPSFHSCLLQMRFGQIAAHRIALPQVFVILNLTAYMYATIKITLWRKKSLPWKFLKGCLKQSKLRSSWTPQQTTGGSCWPLRIEKHPQTICLGCPGRPRCLQTVRVRQANYFVRFRTATTKHDNDLHDRLTDSLVNYEAGRSCIKSGCLGPELAPTCYNMFEQHPPKTLQKPFGDLQTNHFQHRCRNESVGVCGSITVTKKARRKTSRGLWNH